MTVKEYLKQYQSLEAERKNLLSERTIILMDEALPDGFDYSADRVQSSATSDKMLDTVIRIQRRCRYIDSRVAKIDDWMTATKDQINSLKTPEYKRLLYLRYIEYWDWGPIAKELNYWTENSGDVYVRGEIHSKALTEFANYLHKLTPKYVKV